MGIHSSAREQVSKNVPYMSISAPASLLGITYC